MNSKRMYFVMIGVLVLLGGAIAGVTVIGLGMLKQESAKLVELKLENKVLDEQQLALVQANKELEKYKELDTIARSIVPQDKDQARVVREITDIAASFGIKISTIDFPNSSLGDKAVATKPSADGAKPQGVVSQAKPVEGITGVYSIEMTVVPERDASVTYNQLQSFLQRVENNRRTAHVSRIKIDPDPASSQNKLNFELTLTIFIKP